MLYLLYSSVNISTCLSALMFSYIKRFEDDQIEIIEELSFINELGIRTDHYHIEKAKFKGTAMAFLGRWSAWLREDGLKMPSPFEWFWAGQIRSGWKTERFGNFKKPEQEDVISIFMEGKFYHLRLIKVSREKAKGTMQGHLGVTKVIYSCTFAFRPEVAITKSASDLKAMEIAHRAALQILIQ